MGLARHVVIGHSDHMQELYRWRWSRECRIVVVKSRDEVIDACQLSTPDLVICDVEPFLVDWTAPATELETNAVTLERELHPIQVVLCTNSDRFTGARGMPRLISRARKPFTATKRLHGLPSRVTVTGDILIIDGLLALRLRSEFLWFRQPKGEAPPWPRCLAFVDRFLRPLLLKRLESR